MVEERRNDEDRPFASDHVEDTPSGAGPQIGVRAAELPQVNDGFHKVPIYQEGAYFPPGIRASDDRLMPTSSGRTMLVTGSSSGLGRATAHALGQLGARVLVHARTEARAMVAAHELAGVPVWADLGSVEGVRSLAEQVIAATGGELQVLVNNAGGASAQRDLSPEGVERTIAVHHVAPAALTAMLLPALRRGAAASARPSRVVNVSSTVERFGRQLDDWSYQQRFNQWRAYCDAKLLNLALSYALARQFDQREITVNAADPGNVATGFGRNGGVFRLFQGQPGSCWPAPNREPAPRSRWLAIRPSTARPEATSRRASLRFPRPRRAILCTANRSWRRRSGCSSARVWAPTHSAGRPEGNLLKRLSCPRSFASSACAHATRQSSGSLIMLRGNRYEIGCSSLLRTLP